MESEGISSRQGVCGGKPCISGTRIQVWLLETLRRDGCTDAEILACYPTLQGMDLTNAWAYVESHKDEIEQQIQEEYAA